MACAVTNMVPSEQNRAHSCSKESCKALHHFTQKIKKEKLQLIFIITITVVLITNNAANITTTITAAIISSTLLLV
jgi:hypothetical protein